MRAGNDRRVIAPPTPISLKHQPISAIVVGQAREPGRHRPRQASSVDWARDNCSCIGGRLFAGALGAELTGRKRRPDRTERSLRIISGRQHLLSSKSQSEFEFPPEYENLHLPLNDFSPGEELRWQIIGAGRFSCWPDRGQPFALRVAPPSQKLRRLGRGSRRAGAC